MKDINDYYQNEFDATLKSIAEENLDDPKIRHHKARRLCFLAIQHIKNDHVYGQLVTISREFPEFAGVVYERLSKADGINPEFKDKVFAIAGEHFQHERALAEKREKLTASRMKTIVSMGAVAPLESLSILALCTNWDSELSETKVVNAMLDVVNKHTGKTVAAYSHILSRGSFAAIVMTATAASEVSFVDEDDTFPTRVIQALADMTLEDRGNEAGVARLICEVASKQGHSYFPTAFAALVKRGAEISYEKFVNFVENQYYPFGKKKSVNAALQALEAIEAGQRYPDYIQDAIVKIANLDPEGPSMAQARKMLAAIGTEDSYYRITELKNCDPSLADFAEVSGGAAAVLYWQEKLARSCNGEALCLKGLLTLRFNTQRRDPEQVPQIDSAIKKMASNIVGGKAIVAIKRKGNSSCFEEKMETLVFGAGKNAAKPGAYDTRDWKSELNKMFTTVAVEIGFIEPMLLFRRAVEMNETLRRFEAQLAEADIQADIMYRKAIPK